MSLIVQANLLLKQNQITAAESLYRQLLKQNPNNIDALWGLGKVALAFDSYQASYDIFTRCVQLVTNASPLWLSLAQSCQKLKRIEEAEQALLKAYEIKKDSITTLLSLVIFYCQSNQFIQAKKYLDILFSIAPNNIRAFCLKVRINMQSMLDEAAQTFLKKLTEKSDSLTQYEQILLHYAFAQLYQQSSNYKQAFYHFTQANRLQTLQVSFKVADMKGYFSQLMSTFSSTFIDKIKKEQAVNLTQPEKPLLTPIFIVGQPRSGSTLLEQMLISHTDISSAGELPFLAGDIAQGIWQLTKQEFPQGCAHLTVKQRESLAQHYLANMQTLAPKAKFIIDKMPANYQSIGLIKMLFPHAKVIHISRAVKDVSWSIFTNNFDAAEPYFCSMSEIVNYHKNYQQVMSHWQQVLPEFIHNISYEGLVASPKESLTKLLNFCSLSYQEKCLSFENKSRHIDTLSDIQLRHGLQRNIGKGWLPYQEYLPTFFNTLC
jgi:tetratricopeptide (TPR) repeat protein